MTRSLTMAFALLMTWPPAWEQEPKKDEAQVAIEALQTQMRGPVARLGELDESDRQITASNQDEIAELARLKRLELKIKNTDKPAVADRRMTWQRNLERHFANGCPREEGKTGPEELRARCNPVAAQLNTEIAAIEKEEARLEKELAAIDRRRQESSLTTQKNFLKQKANNAERADQQALQIEQEKKLRNLYRNRIVSAVIRARQAVGATAPMSRACNTIAEEEQQVCCHRVYTDGVDPVRCDVKLIYDRFMRGGVFPNSR